MAIAANRDLSEVYSSATVPIVVIFGAFLVLWLPFAAWTTALFYRKRHLSMIAARHPMLVVGSQVCWAAWVGETVAIFLSSIVTEGALPCHVHRTAELLSTQFALLTGLSFFSVRVFALFFVFEITRVKALSQSDMAFVMDKRVMWFVERRHWLSPPFLARVGVGLVATHAVLFLAQLLGGPGGSQCYPPESELAHADGNEAGEGWVWGFPIFVSSVLSLLYGTLGLIFAYRYRKFESDVFGIRRDLGDVGWLTLATVLSWGVFSYMPPFEGFSSSTFPVERLIIAFGNISFHYVLVYRPLQMARRIEASKVPGASELSSADSGGATRQLSERDSDIESDSEGGAGNRGSLAAPAASPRHARRKKKAARHRALLPKLLRFEQFRQAFAQHLQREFSFENFAFWDSVRTFREWAATKKQDKKAEVVAAAEALFQKFLVPEALLEVNVPARMPVAVAQQLKVLKDDPGSDAARAIVVGALFDDAQREILTLMTRDSFPRFLLTEEFAKISGDMRAVSEFADDLIKSSPKAAIAHLELSRASHNSAGHGRSASGSQHSVEDLI